MTKFPTNDFIAQNIIQGATMLIYNLNEEGRLDEEYSHLLYSIDWDAAEDEINGTYHTIVELEGRWCLQSDEDKSICYCYASKQELIQYYYHNDLSDFEVKAAEWWVVSEWLASRLKALGETVDSFYGFTIWARCDSGSAIKTDLVIQEIYNEMIEEV